ncbi:uncharacterized protein CCR75_002126 [Bremia lactucae]|uniref:Uncharacterized protein n=1 Tax=Bremia lactucae TaxID=4779 RepID=A0A976FE10_BRELC|nr:hypothetical protein CCR75_002126 [Bremia lactucae]
MLRTSRRSVRVGETLLSSLLQRSPFSCILIHPASTAALQRLPINVFSSRNAIYNEAAMIRFFCSSRSSDAQRKTEVANVLPHDEKDSSELVYQAPMTRAVRLMKAVSVTSCTLTSLGMPILCIISPQDTSMLAKWAMCGTIMLFGLGTTSLFHFLFQPYVMRMWLVGPATDYHGATSAESTMTVETVTLFAQLQQHSFRLSDVSPPTQAMHPMVSFQACGRHYFIHPESFEDRKLLSHLVGSKASKRISLHGDPPCLKSRHRLHPLKLLLSNAAHVIIALEIPCGATLLVT